VVIAYFDDLTPSQIYFMTRLPRALLTSPPCPQPNSWAPGSACGSSMDFKLSFAVHGDGRAEAKRRSVASVRPAWRDLQDPRTARLLQHVEDCLGKPVAVSWKTPRCTDVAVLWDVEGNGACGPNALQEALISQFPCSKCSLSCRCAPVGCRAQTNLRLKQWSFQPSRSCMT
jgi:hypothetical protein